MTTKELNTFFHEHLVPSRLYDLKGAKNQRLCLEHAKEGWDVYFADHKDKVGLMHFSTEDEACRQMQQEVGKVMTCAYGLSFTA